MAKVSVIVPVYNVELYIERCARSLFAQTLNDIEYIFVDDGSTDNSICILNKVIADYPERKDYIHIIRQTNQGVSTARNRGLENATGDFIAFCDSDDFVSLDMYENLYEKAVLCDADVVYCDFYMYCDNSNCKIYQTVFLSENKVAFMRNYMSSFTTTWNMLTKRSLYDTYNLRFPVNIVYREDFHLSIRLYHYAKVVKKVSLPLYYYNRSNVTSALHQREKKLSNDELLCDLDIISFFTKEKVIGLYKDKLSWGVLRDKQDMVLDINRHKEFLSIYPESHAYIWSCPLINIKMKCLMWLMVTHLAFLAKWIVMMKNYLKR